MGALRDQFLQYMRLKGFAKKTLESYERALVDLTREYGVAPDTLSNAEIQAHLDGLINRKKLAWSTINVRVSACRCFYLAPAVGARRHKADVGNGDEP